MKIRILIAAGATALGLGVVCAPAATAQTGGYQEYPCSEQFRVPWSPEAWDGRHSVVLSPYGTDNIVCWSFHGQSFAYQYDPQGNKHGLDTPLRMFGSLDSNLYIWNPATL